MRYKFFRIPVLDSEEAESALNRFLASHRVVTVEKQFLDDGLGSAWSFCVTYLAGDGSKAPAPGKGAIDYKDVLSPEEFSVYLDLKAKRKAIADEKGIAAFSVFSNAQLAAMIQNRAKSLEDLRKISGIGASRLERFGARPTATATSPASRTTTWASAWPQLKESVNPSLTRSFPGSPLLGDENPWGPVCQ